MHVVDLAPLLANATILDDLLESAKGTWKTISTEMSADETLWVFSPNTYRGESLWPVAMAVADDVRAESDLTLKNLITRYQEPGAGGDMHNAYEDILLFVKDERNYRFNKDSIRESHVYQGNEWGGERKFGNSAYHDTEVQRYNPNGKDPGNVWLREIRDDTGDETVDETRPIPRVEAFRRCLRAGSIEGERVCLWVENDEFRVTAEDEGRNVTVRSIRSVAA